ncbi:hypothetical protein QVD17_09001 [Tagetes erecta]|uniref:Uncharacterized protein n=1 Tax=Tagetes erecta TaxID=13708 RepID=A0AAD8KYJ4_TARER|nr:hypothetical protein QVD17_09001 [Tagetes erecta]
MGTSLRLITSKLVTRSLLPTLVSSSCFHSIINAGHQRGYSTMPKDDFCDHSWLNIKCPKISHLSFTMRMDAINRWVLLSMPDEGLEVDLGYLPALKVEEMKACAEQTLFVQGKPHKEVSLNLLDKTFSSDDIKEEMKDEMIEVTTSNKDGAILNIIANEIISSFCDMTTKRGWAYYGIVAFHHMYLLKTRFNTRMDG